MSMMDSILVLAGRFKTAILAGRKREGLLPSLFLCVCLLLTAGPGYAQKGDRVSVEDYRARYFDGEPKWQMLWINANQRETIEQILGRKFPGFRIRYWAQEDRTGWIFEEIGKELPITTAVVVEANRILNLTVLEYRESRGGEVVYPFFTKQFNAVGLKPGKQHGLDKPIDGITGATLSVRALQKIARLALYCHQQTESSAGIL